MYKFENTSLFFKVGQPISSINAKLNEKGQEGWEVCGVINNSKDEVLFFLKRKINTKRTKG